jgi:hypothetical protein
MSVAARAALVFTSLLALSCSGGGGSSSTGPTPIAPTIPQNQAASQQTTNGCAATYACPNVDVNGTANPSVPTFNTLTLSNGTSSSCRLDIPPQSSGGVGEMPVEFTIRNPVSGFQWTGEQGGTNVSLANSQIGSAATAGPFQATLRLRPGQGSEAGQTIVQTFTLHIRRVTSGIENPIVSSCSVTVWGFFRSERG